MHVTTHIPGRSHDDLLKRNGGRGFPTLHFLDADGKVLASPPERSVAAFEAALDALTRIDEVRARAADGDPVAEADLLLMEHALGKVETSLFRERAALLKGPTEEQHAHIDQILVDLAIWETVGIRDEVEKTERLLRLYEQGKRPSDAPRYAVNFWSILGRHGMTSGDVDLLRGCVEGIRAQFPPDDDIQGYADTLEDFAARWDARNAVARRLEAGEPELAAELLLLDAGLGALSVEDYRARMPAALAVADAEQKEAILQGEVDIEVTALWTGVSRREFSYDEAGERLFPLLFGDGRRPSTIPFRQGLTVAARWAVANLDELDAAQLRSLDEALEKHLGAYDYWKQIRAQVHAKVAELEPGEEPTNGG